MGEKKAKEAARRRSAAEIAEKFQSQWNALASSCLSYDEGHLWEVERIANAVAIFCNDGKQFSLMTLADYRKLYPDELLDTAGEINGLNMMPDHPLVGMQLSPQGATYTNFLDAVPTSEWISFGRWWSKNTVVRFPQGDKRFSRRDIILNVRNSEGGSHVDPYVAIMTDQLGPGSKGLWTSNVAGKLSPMEGTILASSIRQIGHELLRSLQRTGTTLISSGVKYASPLQPRDHVV